MLNLFLLKLKSMTSSWLTQPFNLTVLTRCLFWEYDLSLGKLFFPLSSCKKWNKPQMGTSAQGYLGVCKKKDKKKDKNSVKVMKTSKTSLVCMRGLRCIKDAKIPEKCLFLLLASLWLSLKRFLESEVVSLDMSSRVLMRGLWVN